MTTLPLDLEGLIEAGGYHHLGVNTWAGDALPAGPEDAGLVAWSLVVPTGGDVDRVRRHLEVVAEGQLRPSSSAGR